MKNILIMLLISNTLGAHTHFSHPTSSYNSLPITHTAQIKLVVSQGKATKGYTNAHEKTNILNIFGVHTFHLLGVTQNNTILDTIAKESSISHADWGILQVMTHEVITAINNKTDLGTYGHFNVAGKFSYQQEKICIATPDYKGFHLEALIPFSEFSFSNITYQDLTPATGNGGFNLMNAQWTNFIAKMDAIITGYELSKNDYSERGFEDLEIGLHYHKNFDEKWYLALQGTAIFPTGKKKNENQAFSCPHGHDGHHGFKSGLTLQTALNKYISTQCAFDTTLFSTHTKKIRLKTYPGQQGYLFLLDSNAKRHKGALNKINSHLIITLPEDNFLFTLGYVYTYSHKTRIEVLDTSFFEDTIVNTDPRFASWSRHSLEGSFGYQFKNNSFADNNTKARLIFNVSIPLSGKNIFITNVWGAECSLSYNYEF